MIAYEQGLNKQKEEKLLERVSLAWVTREWEVIF
jgi:hypothetical protein